MVHIELGISKDTLEIDVYDETGEEVYGLTTKTNRLDIVNQITDCIETLIADEIVKM